MQPFQKKYFLSSSPAHRHGERGNVLLLIMAAIVLLGLLTQMVSRSSQQQSDVIELQTRDNQINAMFTQSSTLNGAIQQMVANGEDPATLYQNLLMTAPGDGGFETAPHRFKVYHPLGGGVNYMSRSSSTSDGSAVVADNFKINPGSIVTGVGPTDATIGDILFTASIASDSYCQRINELITGSTHVPVLDTAVFDDLLAGTPVTIDGTNCADCVRVPRICVSNTGGSAWAYYAVLLPG